LEKADNEGNELAKVTLETLSYHVAKYIGAYAAAMNGVDVIAYTAGVGENTSIVRAMVGEYLEFLGTNINPEKNKMRGETVVLSDPGSKVVTMIVPTNEELAICRETVRLVK
jgi:acetate kinase